MTSDKQTTHTINGLRLVTPQEAGYKDNDKDGEKIDAVLMLGNTIKVYCYRGYVCSSISRLIPLPKPHTMRPYKRGEVRCGDVFRRKACGHDYLVTRVCNENVFLGGDYGETTCKVLLDQFQKLTYDSEGREVLECAGIEE